MTKTIEEILTPKPEVRPRIYAYSIADEVLMGSELIIYQSDDGRTRLENETVWLTPRRP